MFVLFFSFIDLVSNLNREGVENSYIQLPDGGVKEDLMLRASTVCSVNSASFLKCQLGKISVKGKGG